MSKGASHHWKSRLLIVGRRYGEILQKQSFCTDEGKIVKASDWVKFRKMEKKKEKAIVEGPSPTFPLGLQMTVKKQTIGGVQRNKKHFISI